MTFLTPTFIAGDRSLERPRRARAGAFVVGQPRHQRQLGRLAGSTRASPATSRTASWKRSTARSAPSQEAALSFADMEEVFAEKGRDAPVTALHLPPAEAAPDGGESGIVYDKGALFLRTVEGIVGRERFDAWLRAVVRQPRVPAGDLGADARRHARQPGQGRRRARARLMLDEWVYGTGLPANAAQPLAERVRRGRCRGGASIRRSHMVDPEAWAGWTTAERLRLIAKLPKELSARAARRARRPPRPVAVGQQRSAVRLARAGARQPLRAGGAGRRGVPRPRRPPQVRAAAVRGADEARATGASRSRGASMPRRGRAITR